MLRAVRTCSLSRPRVDVLLACGPARGFELWALTALLSWLAACSYRREIGENVEDCGSGDCGADAGMEAGLPIGEPKFPAFDAVEFARLADGIAGDWRGKTAGFEETGAFFDLHFEPGPIRGAGVFRVECSDPALCVPFGPFGAKSFFGDYRLIYADREGGGQGEFTWLQPPLPTLNSVAFRSLLLLQNENALALLIDIPLDSFQIVAARQIVRADAGVFQDGGQLEDAGAPWDAGEPEPDAQAPDGAAAP